MGFACPICSERLERQPGEAIGKGKKEVNVSATPCGHIFHDYCIQKWLTGNLASSKQCPCCRKEVPRLRCLALYPTTYDESSLDDTLSQDDSGASQARCENHLQVISELRNRVTRLEKENQEKNQMHKLLSDDFEAMLEKYRREKMNTDLWMVKAKEFESYRDLAVQNETRLKTAETRLKNYSSIEAALVGIEGTVAEELSTFPPNTNSVKTLLEMKHILTTELRTNSKRCEEMKAKYDNLRSEKAKLQCAFDKQTKELKELQHVFEISRLNGRTRERSSSPVARSTASYDTPPVFRKGLIKRRFQEPLASVPGPSPGVDSDVEIIPLMCGKKGKTKKDFSTKKLGETKVSSSSTNSQSSQSQMFSFGPGKSQDSLASHSSRDSGLGNKTILLSSDDESQEMDIQMDDEEANFRVRGNVPGAPLLMSSKRAKNMQEKAKNPTLGLSSKSKPVPGKTKTFR